MRSFANFSRTIILSTLTRPAFILLTLCYFGVSNNSYAVSYENETQITFKANSGEEVSAYQGWVSVPENRQTTDSRNIRITYVRFPALEPKTGNTSPIVYLSGGPGGSGIGTAKQQRFPLFMAMREFGDVIALDQRGLDEGRLPCKSKRTIPQDKVINDKQYTALQKLALQDCLVHWKQQGVDIHGYTTQESALDLDALRRHLKAKKITLWGISYGSHLALAALKVMNDKIDRVIIASVEGLDQTIKLPARTDRYFDRLQKAIDQQPELKKRYPSLKDLIQKVHAQLDKTPLKLTVNKDKKAIPIILQKRDMQSIAAALIADPRSAFMLLDLYQALEADYVEPLEKLLSQYTDPQEPISFSGMSVAMDIASGISDDRYELVLRQAKTSLLADKLNFGLDHFDDIEGIDLGKSFREKPNSNVPTLVLSGTLDGRTYIESQAEAVSGLTNAKIITVNNAGHNLFMSSKEVTTVIQNFMRGAKIKRHDIEIDLGNL